MFPQASHIISMTPSEIALRSMRKLNFTEPYAQHIQRESIPL